MKTALIIIDGLGISADQKTNPLFQSQTPFLDQIIKLGPHLVLEASAEAVGLPFGEPGNSEVGHYNLGTGELNWQSQELINQSIDDGSFFKNKVLIETIENVKKNHSKLHLLGLISDGGTHSKLDHLFALLKLAKDNGLDKNQVFIHGFTDGRDTPQKSALKYIQQIKVKIKQIGLGQIATLCGRFYAMDRDDHFERTFLAYDAIVYGKGTFSPDANEGIGLAYQEGETDEFIKPIVILDKEQKPNAKVEKNDSLIVFNYRADRVRQIVKAFLDPKTNRTNLIAPLLFTTMTPYETDWNLKINTVFKPITPKITISKLLAQNNLSQLHLAETEKYAHITYFFNGGLEKEQNKEKFLLVASPRVNSYDQTPQMSAKEITLALKNELNNNSYDFIAINLANCDMVGHTGNFKAIIKAAENVDHYLKLISQILDNYGYNIFITADHGNAEQAINPSTGEIDKQHTINPVFFINLNPDCFRPSPYLNHQTIWLNLALEQKKAVLCDVTATLSNYLNIKNENFAGEKIL